MKPRSLTARSSSGTTWEESFAPETCGSPATPWNLSGCDFTCLAMTSLFASHHQWTMLSGFSECINWKGRGERNWTSVWTLSMILMLFWANCSMRSSEQLSAPLPW